MQNGLRDGIYQTSMFSDLSVCHTHCGDNINVILVIELYISPCQGTCLFLDPPENTRKPEVF